MISSSSPQQRRRRGGEGGSPQSNTKKLPFRLPSRAHRRFHSSSGDGDGDGDGDVDGSARRHSPHQPPVSRILLILALIGNAILISRISTVIWLSSPSSASISNSHPTIKANSATTVDLHYIPPPQPRIVIEELPFTTIATTQYPPLRRTSWGDDMEDGPIRGVSRADKLVPILPPDPAAAAVTAASANAGGVDSTVFAFCLLMKDDNDILNEWIAYHYHVLNLRRLIVAVDPSSTTTPIALLEEWRVHFGLRWEIWQDDRFLPDYFLKGEYGKVPRMLKFQDTKAIEGVIEGGDSNGGSSGNYQNTTPAHRWQDGTKSQEQLKQEFMEINNHRYRQAKFLQHCGKALQDEATTMATAAKPPATMSNEQPKKQRQERPNHQWMTHIDTDEYIVLNPTLRHNTGLQPPLVPVPSSLEPNGALLDFLERSLQADKDIANWPCISMPRILYGSIEDGSDDNNPPAGQTRREGRLQSFQRTKFETLRWKCHADYANITLNKQPKVIMDVTGFPAFNVSQKAFSIHRPSMHLCRAAAQMNVLDGDRYPLVVHHYLGSWERYEARQDPRRNKNLYWQKAKVQEGGRDDDWIDGWLEGFVDRHGMDKVSRVMGDYLVEKEPTAKEKKKKEGGVVLELGRTLPVEQDDSSACLLVKDDNDILNEWIAYHYHVLKLRALIVATDPSSKTRPSKVLKRWRELVEIEEWNDEAYMPDFFLQKQFDQVPNLMGNATNTSVSSLGLSIGSMESFRDNEELVKVNNHRFRQVTFLSRCFKTFNQKNKTWVFHIDSDEYISLHPDLRTHNHWRKLALNPKIDTPSSLFELLKRAASEYSKGLRYPCVSMPRLLYGSKEDMDDSLRFSKVPKAFDGSKFESLRWKYHSHYDQDVKLNGKPKAIMDLTGFPPKAQVLDGKIYSIHRPGLHVCRSDRSVLFDRPHHFPLTINHYIGSWERYSHRDDARRNRSIYDAKALVEAGKDDEWIDDWVSSFVQEHGAETAKRLLAEYTASENGQEENELSRDREAESPGESLQVLGRAVNTTSTGNITASVESFDASKHMEFSACLLVKDDNDILNEWIAYHYHVLGLRYMIVAVDAKSHTSPSPLLEKWRTFGMTIEEWKDEMFMSDSYFRKEYWLQPRLVKIKKNRDKWMEGIDDPEIKKKYVNDIQDHRFRQITFVASCTRRLVEQGRTWMIHIDTDEYIVVNPKLRQLRTFGSDIPIPPTAEASVVPRLLNELVVKSWETINYPCVSLPRLLFGSVEDSTADRAPRSYNHSRFESLRWKYHADFEDSDLNKQPKVILDVSAIAGDEKMFLEGRVFSIHRPTQELCRSQGQMQFDNVDYFPFTVNHYLGTFARFGARDDLRRNRKVYDQKANVQAGKDRDGWMDTWLPSFIQAHGENQVSNLLEAYWNRN